MISLHEKIVKNRQGHFTVKSKEKNTISYMQKIKLVFCNVTLF